MGAEGLEPSRPYDQQILSLLRLPFRHAPRILALAIGLSLLSDDLYSYNTILGVGDG